MWILLPFLALQTIEIGCTQSPQIVEHPADVVVARNEPVTLACKVAGDPEPSVEWFKDGRRVSTAQDDPRSHRILLPDNGLFFLRAQQSKKQADSGEYWCRATNRGGSVSSARAHLQVAYLDKEFQGLPSDVDVSVGATVVISCKAPKGFPPPSITWLKDGRLYSLEDGSRMEGGSLVISSVTKKHFGQYQCRAENMAGVRESPTVTLGVHEKPYFISKPKTEHVAMVGGDLELGCKVGGDPPPRVTWTRVGDNGDTNPISEGATLHLSNVHPSDEGSYQCRAENVLGSVTTELELRVQERPVLTVSPETDVQVTEGQEVKLSCLATGRPAPTVFWGKEGVFSVLFPGMSVANVHVTGDGGLKIRDPVSENSGRYTCSVVNEVGAAMAMSRVTVVSRNSSRTKSYHQPASEHSSTVEIRQVLHQQRMVEISQVSSVSEDSLEVEWRYVGSRSHVSGVVIQYRPSSSRYAELDRVVVDSVRTTAHTLTGLQPGTEYSVFLQPYSGSVVGLPSSIRLCRTRAPQPSLRRTEILAAEMINVTTAFIVWTSQQPDTGITGYQVVLKNNKTSLSTRVGAGVSEVFLKLNPRDLSSHYLVSVAPVTLEGPGTFCPPVNLSLPADLLPISVQPNLAEVESTAWLVVLLGSLAFMFLLLSSVMFYYRRRKVPGCSGGTSSGYLPAAVSELEYQHKTPGVLWSDSEFPHKTGVLWSERHWSEAGNSDSYKMAAASPVGSEFRQYRAPLLSGQRSLDPVKLRTKTSASESSTSTNQPPPAFESPYATSNVVYDPERKIKVSTTMHELQVTPLLHKGAKSRHRPKLQRASQSYDECGGGEQLEARQHYLSRPAAKYKRQRSNPNILDLIPPPPPLYAPPSLPGEPAPSSAPSTRHSRQRRDSDTSEYFTQGSSECPVHRGDSWSGDQHKYGDQELVEQVLRHELSSFHETVSHFG